MRSGQLDGSAGHNTPGSGPEARDLPRQVPSTTSVTNPYFLVSTPEGFPTGPVAATDYITAGTNTNNHHSVETTYQAQQQQQQQYMWRPDSQTPTVIRG